MQFRVGRREAACPVHLVSRFERGICIPDEQQDAWHQHEREPLPRDGEQRPEIGEREAIGLFHRCPHRQLAAQELVDGNRHGCHVEVPISFVSGSQALG